MTGTRMAAYAHVCVYCMCVCVLCACVCVLVHTVGRWGKEEWVASLVHGAVSLAQLFPVVLEASLGGESRRQTLDCRVLKRLAAPFSNVPVALTIMKAAFFSFGSSQGNEKCSTLPGCN